MVKYPVTYEETKPRVFVFNLEFGARNQKLTVDCTNIRSDFTKRFCEKAIKKTLCNWLMGYCSQRRYVLKHFHCSDKSSKQESVNRLSDLLDTHNQWNGLNAFSRFIRINDHHLLNSLPSVASKNWKADSQFIYEIILYAKTFEHEKQEE